MCQSKRECTTLFHQPCELIAIWWNTWPRILSGVQHKHTGQVGESKKVEKKNNKSNHIDRISSFFLILFYSSSTILSEV